MIQGRKKKIKTLKKREKPLKECLDSNEACEAARPPQVEEKRPWRSCEYTLTNKQANKKGAQGQRGGSGEAGGGAMGRGPQAGGGGDGGGRREGTELF